MPRDRRYIQVGAVDWIAIQSCRVFPSGSEEDMHNSPALLSIERLFECTGHVRVPSSTSERDCSYGPTTTPSSVTEITDSRDHTLHGYDMRRRNRAPTPLHLFHPEVTRLT